MVFIFASLTQRKKKCAVFVVYAFIPPVIIKKGLLLICLFVLCLYSQKASKAYFCFAFQKMTKLLGLKRPAVVVHDTYGLKNFWEEIIETHTRQKEMEDSRITRSALNKWVVFSVLHVKVNSFLHERMLSCTHFQHLAFIKCHPEGATKHPTPSSSALE